MLIIYPMLISNAVSENIIPGIVKTAEAFIVVNQKIWIIDNPDVKRKFKIKLKSGRLTMQENTSVLEEADDIPYDSPENWKDSKDQMRRKEKEKDTKKAEEKRTSKTQDKIKSSTDKKEDEDEETKKAKSSIKISDNRAVSIEPSTAELDIIDKNGNSKQEVLGIKVIPLRVRSDTKLSRLILHDVQLSNINALTVSFGRYILRKVYNVSKWWSSRRTLSGDPRRDIIMNRSGQKGKGFIVLSKTEDIDETFMSNISRLNRLFAMGWGNIIIVDDIKRQVHFCMESFKGVCTTLSFSTIYQNLGHLGVYETLEDAKKKTSMLFKTKSNFKKLFAEYKTQYKLSKYLSERIKNNE